MRDACSAQLRLDADGVAAALTAIAETSCQLRVLRTYWYDGARDGVPTPSQQRIAALPNLKLRLGRVNTRNEQKRVDALIYRDLMTLARERAIADAFLLSGDEDLREGVRAAQDMGVRVTLFGIPPTSQEYNQSRELVNEADEIVILTNTQLSPHFALVEPELPMPEPGLAAEAGLLDKVHGCATEFATEWRSRATEADKAALSAQRPRIPRTLDIELIKAAESVLAVSLRGNDPAHRALRKTFWTAAFPPSTEVDEEVNEPLED